MSDPKLLRRSSTILPVVLKADSELIVETGTEKMSLAKMDKTG